VNEQVFEAIEFTVAAFVGTYGAISSIGAWKVLSTVWGLEAVKMPLSAIIFVTALGVTMLHCILALAFFEYKLKPLFDLELDPEL